MGSGRKHNKADLIKKKIETGIFLVSIFIFYILQAKSQVAMFAYHLDNFAAEPDNRAY